MLFDSTILDDLSAGIPHIGSLLAHRAIQTRWWHHSQVLQGQANSGLSNKGCDSRREPCFLSVHLEAPTSPRPLPTSPTWNSPHLPSPRPYSYVHSSIFRFTPVPSESTSRASWSGNEKPAI